jgi:hypothetical protein
MKKKLKKTTGYCDRLCGLVDRAPGYKSGGPVSIPRATRFSEKHSAWNGVHSTLRVQLRSYLEKTVAASVKKTEITDARIRYPDHVAPSIRKSSH